MKILKMHELPIAKSAIVPKTNFRPENFEKKVRIWNLEHELEIEIIEGEGDNYEVTGNFDKITAKATTTTADPTHSCVRIFRTEFNPPGPGDHAGNTDWVFDEKAVCLHSESGCSSTGYTGSAEAIVAFSNERSLQYGPPEPVQVSRQYGETQFHYDWALRENDKKFFLRDAVTDDINLLAPYIWGMDNGELYKNQLTCRHNSLVQWHVLTENPRKVGYLLCSACRYSGVREQEFFSANQQDKCPYLRKAVKAFAEKTDQFPSWFMWQGNNLFGAQKRLENANHMAFEVLYKRKKDGFIRKAVLLLKLAEQKKILYPYMGYIPKTLKEFREKYSDKWGKELKNSCY